MYKLTQYSANTTTKEVSHKTILVTDNLLKAFFALHDSLKILETPIGYRVGFQVRDENGKNIAWGNCKSTGDVIYVYLPRQPAQKFYSIGEFAQWLKLNT